MSQTAIELQNKIRSTIPLSEAMQFEIVGLDANSIRVHAPLSPNINIHGTGFAGSIYSLAVLTGWAMCMHVLTLENIKGELVVGKAEIKYRSAVTGGIECKCEVEKAARQSFVERIASNGKGKLTLEVIVGAETNAVLLGTYFVNAKH